MSDKKPSPVPVLYFDARSGQYWLRIGADLLGAGGRFMALDKSEAKLHLREAGLSDQEWCGSLNELERAFYAAQVERAVDYAGPLAGHKCGVFGTSDGKKVLVTQEPRFDLGKAKTDWEWIEQFLGQLFGPEQLKPVLGWLKFARESLLKGDFRPGQLLALAGPSGCGKSFFQALVTEFLGGRSAKPYRYMMGETNFNSDLCSAEHQYIEDENASTDIRARRRFGVAIKESVNVQVSLHAKGRQAITLPTYKRFTLSVNDEPENLSILPPLDNSLLDKITLLKCSRAELSEDRAQNWREMTAALPAFAEFLAKWKVPKAMADPRYGVRAYHNPELFDLLTDLSPEMRLLNLIDEILWSKERDEWDGTSEQLERELRNSSFQFAVEKLLYFAGAAGTYLGRLAQKNPGRISGRKVKGRTVWTLHRREKE